MVREKSRRTEKRALSFLTKDTVGTVQMITLLMILITVHVDMNETVFQERVSRF